MKNSAFILFLTALSFFAYRAGAQEKFPATKFDRGSIVITYAIYFADGNHPTAKEAANVIENKFPDTQVSLTLFNPDTVSGKWIYIEEITNPAEEYPAADMESLPYMSRGLSEEQGLALQDSEYVLLFGFTAHSANAAEVIKDAHWLVAHMAEDNNDIIWDNETREYFTRDHWKEFRSFKSDNVNITKQINIHAYRTGEYCRVITLGMYHLGLPDVAIENTPCSSTAQAGNLVNLVAQTLYENRKISKEGKLTVNIDKLKNEELKDFLTGSLQEGAKGKATLDIVKGTWQDGDSENDILEISFPGADPMANQIETMKEIFGGEDELFLVSRDEALQAASDAAKEKLPRLYELFQNRDTNDITLMMKFPFTGDDGASEFMWVEVTKWEDQTVTGILMNEPYYVSGLGKGDVVKSNASEMFDYILYNIDGTTEGGETERIIAGQDE